LAPLGQHPRKCYQDKQSDNRNYNKHDHHPRVAEVLAANNERGADVALRGA
jgi:hypothetical protein